MDVIDVFCLLTKDKNKILKYFHAILMDRFNKSNFI